MEYIEEVEEKYCCYTPQGVKSLELENEELKAEILAYRQAEEQGLLIKLPCKVGDAVYFIDGEYNDGGFWKGLHDVFKGTFDLSMIYRIGKTVFLTREAAEEALKGGIS